MPLVRDFSIQLYSLREETAQDFAAVLERLGQIGYTGVEFAGYGEFSAPEMRQLLDRNQLRSVGSHVSLERLRENLAEELAYNQVLGTDYIIVPWSDIKTRSEAEVLAAELTLLGQKITSAGFGFAYHNHDHELVLTEGQRLMDILLEKVPSSLMDWEMDLFWGAYAGIDLSATLKRYSNRIRLLHLKQMKDFESKLCVDLDEGVLDFSQLIQEAQSIGVKHFILEQEAFAVSPFTSVEKGYRHIMSL